VTRRRGGMRTARRLLQGTRHQPPGEPEPPRDPYVRVSLIVTLLDECHEPVDATETELPIDRAGWDRLTPARRRIMLDRAARDNAFQRIDVCWEIADPGDAHDALADIEHQGE